MKNPVRYFIELEDTRFAVRRLRGRESLSRPYRFEAWLPLEGARDPEAFVKKPVHLVLADDREEMRRIEGVVTEANVSATAHGAPELYLVVEPSLALARYRSDVRVFRDMSAVDIVNEVLAALGLELERRLSEPHPPRAYCVQMRETDLDFVSRLLEEEGIAYFTEGAETIVLADRPGAYQLGVTLPYRAAAGMDQFEESVVELSDTGELSAGSATVRDFNPETPSLDLEANHAVPELHGPEFYDYPGGHPDPQEGKRIARLMAEAFACAAAALEGRAFSARLSPGYKLALVEAPAGIRDGEYLVTAVEHDFDVDRESTSVAFKAHDASKPWRPARVTPAPTLTNPMTGFVTGPPGEDIHTDALGRVKVIFPWDRRQPWDDNCSDWIPVLQDNTGHSVGIPRIGWEVLVHFLEGNPDRPVVLGRVYNGADPFPEALPGHKTRSALQSLSSPGRDGSNMIRFEDRGGAEQVFVHAERDQRVVIAHDRREDVGVNESQRIYRDETVVIGVNDTEGVAADRYLTIEGNQSITIGGNRSREVAQMDGARVKGNRSLSIGASHSRRIGTDDAVIAKHIKEQIGAVVLETSLQTNATSAGAAGTLTVGGALVEVTAKTKSEETKLARAEIIGGIVLSKSGKVTALSCKGRTTNIGGALSVNALKALKLDGGLKLTASALLGSFNHPVNITLKVGGSSVTLGAGVVSVTAPSKISVSVGGENQLGSKESTQA
jgi:type VI secretion system secreted protein VgrG